MMDGGLKLGRVDDRGGGDEMDEMVSGSMEDGSGGGGKVTGGGGEGEVEMDESDGASVVVIMTVDW